MRLNGALVLLLAGCGRVGFDSRADPTPDAPWMTAKMFGASALGANQGLQTQDAARFARWTLPDEALVTSITLSLAGNGVLNTQPIVAVIYSDNAGEPDQLVARSVEIDYSAASVTPEWVDFALPTAVRLSRGAYWIGDHTGGPANTFFTYDDLVGAGRRPLDPYADGTAAVALPDNPSDRQYAFYASYFTAP